MFHDAPNVNYLFAQLLVEELVRQGVEWFVIAPGSRSAPLAISIAAHPRAKHVVHIDERGAAFHALGIAKASLKPAAFVCTSGTATANALPAAVEASYSGIPLVLITADRPERLQGAGANQTINQHGIYREFVRHETNFSVDDSEFDAAEMLTQVDHALSLATASWPGPVHLNCQFDEPLAPITAPNESPSFKSTLAPLSNWLAGDAPLLQRPTAPQTVNDGELQWRREIMARPAPGLIVVGELSGPQEHDEVHALLDRLQWPFIPDITSGLRIGPPLPWSLWSANHYANELLEHAEKLIHIGGPLTSRRLLDAVAKFGKGGNSGKTYVRISPQPGALDPHGNVSLRIVGPTSVLAEFEPDPSAPPPLSFWPEHLLGRSMTVFETLSSHFSPTSPVTELSAAYFLSTFPPTNGILFAGNSMPIRDLDIYGFVNLQQTTWVAANRGASGIDGNIATAAGVARATGQPLVALIGDLAALHDLNSLALLRSLPAPVVVVVVNNDGGGIFSFLPVADHAENFEPLFGTPHKREFAHAAAMFGLQQNTSCVIEIKSNREDNLRQHRELDAKIRAALDKPSA